MIKIVNTIVFGLFLLSVSEKSLSAQGEDFPNEEGTLKRTSKNDYRTNKTPIISPQPLRYTASLSTIIEEQEESNAREEIKAIKTHNEQVFRSNTFQSMIGADQRLLMPRENVLIHIFTLSNAKVHFNDGFYQRVNFFDVYRRPISPDIIQSPLLPLTVIEPINRPDGFGNIITFYVPRFMGYAYRKWSGFWLWVDSPKVVR
jgi:hypothetical protein